MPIRSKKKKTRIVKKTGLFNRDRFFYWVKKTGLFVLLAVGLLWLASWFFLSDMSSQTQSWVYSKTLNITQNLGLELQNVNVEGRYYADTREILSAIELKKGDPILAFDEEQSYNNLKEIEWISDAYVRRIFPNTIYIVLEENIPLALLKEGDALTLIDVYGEGITQRNISQWRDLIIVSGQNAQYEAPNIIKSLRANSALFQEVETAQYISERRWDIYLKNGMKIQLPETDISLALSTLLKMQEEDKIFEKNISMIDMRNLSRIIVRMKNGDQFETNESAGISNGDFI